MKEFMGTSVNIGLVETVVGGYLANAELIIVTGEPNYSISSAGEMVKSRECGHFRFGIMTKGLRSLIKSLTEYADEMEKTEERIIEKLQPQSEEQVA